MILDDPIGRLGRPEESERTARHMTTIDAALTLAVLAAGRARTADEVTAREMGARRLCARWFQSHRRFARRRAEAQDIRPVRDAAPGLGGPGCPGCPGKEDRE